MSKVQVHFKIGIEGKLIISSAAAVHCIPPFKLWEAPTTELILLTKVVINTFKKMRE